MSPVHPKLEIQMATKKSQFIFPVFGRINGNIEGLLNTLQYMQKRTLTVYNSVLQLGDLGFVLDEALLRDMQLKELTLMNGTHRFLKDGVLYDRYFSQASANERLNCSITFIAGSLDDQVLLNSYRHLHPVSVVNVDKWSVLKFLPSCEGIAYIIDRAREILVVGFGEDMEQYGEAEVIKSAQLLNSADIVLSYRGFRIQNKYDRDIAESYQKTRRAPLYIQPLKDPHINLQSTPIPTINLKPMPLYEFPLKHSAGFFGCVEVTAEDDKSSETYKFIPGEEFL